MGKYSSLKAAFDGFRWFPVSAGQPACVEAISLINKNIFIQTRLADVWVLCPSSHPWKLERSVTGFLPHPDPGPQ